MALEKPALPPFVANVIKNFHFVLEHFPYIIHIFIIWNSSRVIGQFYFSLFLLLFQIHHTFQLDQMVDEFDSSASKYEEHLDEMKERICDR